MKLPHLIPQEILLNFILHMVEKFQKGQNMQFIKAQRLMIQMLQPYLMDQKEMDMLTQQIQIIQTVLVMQEMADIMLLHMLLNLSFIFIMIDQISQTNQTIIKNINYITLEVMELLKPIIKDVLLRNLIMVKELQTIVNMKLMFHLLIIYEHLMILTQVRLTLLNFMKVVLIIQ